MPTVGKRRKLRRAVRRRDGDDCHLCGGLMLFSGYPLGPDFATLDRVVPGSKGGRYEIDNLKLAHRRCNVARGDDPLPYHSETATSN